jgi:Protein of unknown function (DUF1592)/Protein of unknown function (DUF1588)/Protein of unknown function (DUF1595)/Protein of unknown function (DUF1587)/Protein of unknown function (DUF1585)
VDAHSLGWRETTHATSVTNGSGLRLYNMRMFEPRAVCCFAAVIVVAGCTGQIDSSRDRTNDDGKSPTQTGGMSGSETGTGGAISSTSWQACKPSTAAGVGRSPLRRLTNEEYNQTVHDLLGDTTRPADGFPSEPISFGFRNSADTIFTDENLVDQYRGAAERLSEVAAKNAVALAECDPAREGDAVCSRQFITRFGQRAWRRPLNDTEASSLQKVFDLGRKAGPFSNGVALVAQALLQSAPFLYRLELGVGESLAGEGVVRLTSWEAASRLSYALWGSMPDDALFALAASDKLQEKEQIVEQARRMLSSEKTRRQVLQFHREWLSLDEVAHAEKDTRAFPTFTDATPALFREETTQFLTDVLWNQTGSWQSMLTASHSFANSTLAKHYSLPDPKSSDFKRIPLEGTGRLGILSQGSVTAAHAKSNQTSPILRGKFVRERLLCQQLPSPPANADTKAPELSASLTTRERFALHTADAGCASCHALMDPLGLGFENFDGAGGWRESENGKAIDSTGELTDSDVDGNFDGVAELSTRLASSGMVRMCVATQWFRFGFGRGDSEADACSVRLIAANLGQDASLEDLLLAVVSSDAFLYKTAGGAQ